MTYFWARRENHFQKEICPKRTFPSDFLKLGSEILYLFLAEKRSFVCFRSDLVKLQIYWTNKDAIDLTSRHSR